MRIDSRSGVVASNALALVLALGCSGPFPGTENGGLPPLDFDLLFGENPDGRRPDELAWAPGGHRLGFFFDDGDGKGLWILDTESGETVLQGRESQGGLGKLAAFHWSPTGDELLLEDDGDLALLHVAGSSGFSGSDTAERLEPLTSTDVDEEDPKFSPDGRYIAFVRSNDLWLYDLDSGTERRLTHDGEEGRTLNGKTDWVYWEEIWGRKQVGHWWSPDGSQLAYYRFDVSSLSRYPLIDYTARYPEVTWQRYPKAGETNPIVKVGVLDLATGETAWLASNADDDAYLARVGWLPSGDRVAIQRLNRDQDRLELESCPTSGEACSTLLEEAAKTWVNLTRDLRFLEDGRFLWTTERSGWRELWLHAADGSPLRKLTPDGWTTESVNEVVEAAGSVVWTGYATGELGAIHRTVLSQLLEAGATSLLSSTKVTASVTTASTTGRAAILESTADEPHKAFVVDLGGRRLAELPTLPPAGYDPAELPRWKFLSIPGPDRSDLPAALLEPSRRLPGRKYPVIQYHYGGPASQVVRDAWGSRGRGLWHKMMAARGYGVLMVDNPGSNFFGKTGADRLHRRFGEVNLAAQQAGVEYLERLAWADAERVGLWGWSGGGSNTLYSLLNAPGTWSAGVAGAPVTDWRLYDTIWTERYLDHPDDNEAGYRNSSAVTHAGNLTDALLLVHGTADDNVHPQNTMAMSAALIAADKPFEMAIHPGQKHGFRGQNSRHFYERMTRFFDRELHPKP